MQTHQVRLTRPSKEPKPKKARLNKLRKKRRKMIAIGNVKGQVVTLLQLVLILLRPQKVKKRCDVMARVLEKTFLRLLIIIILRKAITLGITLS